MPGNTSNRPYKVYCCAECGETEVARTMPARGQCRVHGFHRWVNLGEEGGKTYRCIQCGLQVNTLSTPSSYGCKESGFHDWARK